MDENFCPTCFYSGHDNTVQTIHKPGEICPKLLTIKAEELWSLVKSQKSKEITPDIP